jgi:hypothetical protein
MATASIRCPVLGAHVTHVTDLEGNVTRIICPEYFPSTGTCGLKTAALKGGRYLNWSRDCPRGLSRPVAPCVNCGRLERGTIRGYGHCAPLTATQRRGWRGLDSSRRNEPIPER